MQYFGLLSLLVVVVVMGWWITSALPVQAPEESSPTVTEKELDPVIAAEIAAKADLIRLTTPTPQSIIDSPLTVSGVARGFWFFEASFPVVLTDWDGRIIAEHFATAEGEWMTEDFVPFSMTLEFENPYKPGDPDFMRRGSLILMRDNPSGLPENDDALEIPVVFGEKNAAASVRADATYSEAIDAAKDAASLLSN
jgi:hypothetical protein